jgi:glycosyltransferase involved in cell wall biosynthesis
VARGRGLIGCSAFNMANAICLDPKVLVPLRDDLVQSASAPHLSHDAPTPIETTTPFRPLSGKRVVVVLYASYPADPRPRRAAEALVEAGASVELICLRETRDELRHEMFNGVDISRIALRQCRGSKFSYVFKYASFLLLSGLTLARRAFERRYDLVHVHNMPDALVFSALVPKLLGAKVILDLHDPMPELMMGIFGLRSGSFSVRLLKSLEKWSIQYADLVLTANEACKNLFLARGCLPKKLSVVMNSPDEAIFPLRKQRGPQISGTKGSKPFVIMYHGLLVERHGLDLAVLALEKIKKSIPTAELRIYGRSTPFLKQVLDTVRGTELSNAVRFFGPKTLEQIPAVIQDCDVGIIPNQRSLFTELNTPTRILEFISQGKPVIAPRTRGILDYFGPQDLIFFELGDAGDLAAKIEYVFTQPQEVGRILERGQEVYRRHSWSDQRARFVSLVAGLLSLSEARRVK